MILSLWKVHVEFSVLSQATFLKKAPGSLFLKWRHQLCLVCPPLLPTCAHIDWALIGG